MSIAFGEKSGERQVFNLSQEIDDQIASLARNPRRNIQRTMGCWKTSRQMSKVGGFASDLYYPDNQSHNTGRRALPPNKSEIGASQRTEFSKLIDNDESVTSDKDRPGKGRSFQNAFLSDVQRRHYPGTHLLWDFRGPLNTKRFAKRWLNKLWKRDSFREIPKPKGFLLELLRAACDDSGIRLDLLWRFWEQ